VHVTLRVRRGLPNLRGYKLARAIAAGLRRASTAEWARQKARRRTFRVIHYSVQSNHLHLIVEATSKAALGRGMQGLASGLARRVNGRLARRGAVFADRYHGHALATPTEMRNALVYVMKNFEKHGADGSVRDGIDPCSSARWFAGWAHAPEYGDEVPPVAQARTWLARVGWRRFGLIERHERPA
jgi:REP element-mobilizing transposase RayT